MTFRLDFNQKKAVLFDGTNDYLYATAGSTGKANLNPEGDEAFSVTAWLRCQKAFGQRQFIYTKANASSPYDGIWLEWTANGELKFVFTTNNSGTSNGVEVVSGTDLYDGVKDTWALVCCTYDGSETLAGTKIYLNGEEVSDSKQVNPGGTLADMSAGSSATAHKASIGSLYNYYSARMGGGVCSVAQWQVALSASEISELYRGTGNKPGPGNLVEHSQYSNLVAWWISDNASDSSSTIHDSKGSFNMTGFSLSSGQIYPVNI